MIVLWNLLAQTLPVAGRGDVFRLLADPLIAAVAYTGCPSHRSSRPLVAPLIAAVAYWPPISSQQSPGQDAAACLSRLPHPPAYELDSPSLGSTSQRENPKHRRYETSGLKVYITEANLDEKTQAFMEEESLVSRSRVQQMVLGNVKEVQHVGTTGMKYDFGSFPCTG